MEKTRQKHPTCRALAVAALVLAGALPARAGTVVATAPQYQTVGSPNECWLVNPGVSAVAVTSLELVNQGGTVLASSTVGSIAPGAIAKLQGSGGGLTYCRATGVSAKKVRLSQCVRSSTGAPCAAITTAP